LTSGPLFQVRVFPGNRRPQLGGLHRRLHRAWPEMTTTWGWSSRSGSGAGPPGRPGRAARCREGPARSSAWGARPGRPLRCRRGHGVAFVFQDAAERGADARFVVDDEDAVLAHAGIFNVNWAPWGGVVHLDGAVMLFHDLTDNGQPQPGAFLLRREVGRNSLSLSSTGMPGPYPPRRPGPGWPPGRTRRECGFYPFYSWRQ